MGTINKVFLYNGDPQNGAIAQLWKITAFAAYVDSTANVSDNPLAATSVECLTSNGAVFAVGDVIKIQNECCLIWAKSGNTVYIIRGWHGTAPAAHAINTDIYDETITPPVVDDAVPGAGQQGGNITTGVAYGGDGAYRFDNVPEMEYYASVTYDAHITYVHCFVERNDITPEQILTLDGDLLIRNADTITRLPIGTAAYVLTSVAGRPAWAVAPGPSLVIIKKTGDETVNNSAAFQNDNELLLPVGADEVWLIFLVLVFESSVVANIKFQLTVPANALGYMFIAFTDAANAPQVSGYQTITAQWTNRGDGAGVKTIKTVWAGKYVGKGTAGNVQLQWAQNTAEVSDTKVLIGSAIIAIKASA